MKENESATGAAIRLIRATRLAAGLTQVDLGQMALLGSNVVCAMELRGKATLSTVGAAIDALLVCEQVQALGEDTIVKLRASLEELRVAAVSSSVDGFEDVHPLTSTQIKNIRKILGMTQVQLAHKLLLRTSVSVSNWERKTNPYVPRALHRARLVKLGAKAVGDRAGLTGKAAEDLLFSTLDLMAGPVVQEEESGQEDDQIDSVCDQTANITIGGDEA